MLISDWSSDVCSSDLVLEQQPDVREHFSAAEEPIDDIPDSQWTAVPEVEAPHPEPQLTVHDFRWETDTSGMILWVDGIAREAVIGRTVALSEPEAIEGVDMKVATAFRSEGHTSEIQSLMRISYDSYCLKKKKQTIPRINI